ncbi:hypothetical protein NDN08_007215 [Rhodosorus marinus]|uniref:C2H2-type domain-containing protein n=1 Tax=Rhodosorus marinus TaxID=101924 RepID=A0AAV8UFW7_9RHOD|nr:hypothetical protein NDN08_007215 [Rhodosorus marinus]
MKWSIPEATRVALDASEVGQLISIFSEPSLMMTELREETFSLGSCWAFRGGLPEHKGRVNRDFQGFERVRFLSYSEDSRAVSILSAEVGPGLLAFSKVVEEDGRHTSSLMGLLDTATETITHCAAAQNRHSCDTCRVQNVPCDPLKCHNEQDFELALDYRRQILEQSESPRSISMQYIILWLSGTWTCPMEPLEPMTYSATCHLNGSTFDSALLSVLQDEISGSHPPRASFRIVSEGRKEMDHFLGLELDEFEFSSSEEWSPTLTPTADFLSQPSGKDHGVKKTERICQICNASFRRSYDLKRHTAAIHEKRRDFICPKCPKTYTQKGHLNEHIRMVHCEEPGLQCPVCKKQFGIKSKLERHISTVHENMRSFKCLECSKSYKERSYLKQHLLTQHNIRMEGPTSPRPKDSP